MKNPQRNILLNPGPATTTDSVKHAQVVPDICPREKEFGKLMTEIANDLTAWVGDPSDYTTVLFGGSGTAALEAMVTSTVGQQKLLVINNGTYGQRLVDIAKTYDISVIDYKSSMVDPIDTIHLEETIRAANSISHLIVVHHETTTGLLNDLIPLGQICSHYGVTFMVDAMSSYGAIPIDMKAMNISFLASSSNKNLQGMAGIGFVIGNKAALENLKNIPARSYYLNLFQQYRYFETQQQMRFTPPVQVLYALKQAITELKQEGIEARYKRYQNCWQVLVNGLKDLQLSYLVNPAHHSRLITAVCEPQIPRYSFEDMHDYLYRRNITIYPGKLKEQSTFRIANIGDLYPTDITTFLNHLAAYLHHAHIRAR